MIVVFLFCIALESLQVFPPTIWIIISIIIWLQRLKVTALRGLGYNLLTVETQVPLYVILFTWCGITCCS